MRITFFSTHEFEVSVGGAMKAACKLTTAVGGLMLVQSALGLLFREQYRDVEWIAATWFGNDWATLAIALPLLASD